MKKLRSHPFMERRTVVAYETNSGGYVQVCDVRDLYYGEYCVEHFTENGGMAMTYSSPNLEKCIAKAEKYAAEH